MFGITESGYVRKNYSAWIADLQTKARSVEFFGPEQDLSDADPIGISLKLFAYALEQQDQRIEDSYYSLYPATASGVSLDRAMSIGGVERRYQESATVTLTFTGIDASIITVNSIAETSQGIRFRTLESGVIDGTTVSVLAQCETPGSSGLVPANSITNLITPISGVDSVTNMTASSGGNDQATDPEARTEYVQSKTGSAASVPGLYQALMSLEGVNSVYVALNESETVDSEGRPPHSREIVVDGGRESDIAQTLWQYHVGLYYVGVNEYIVTAENGQLFVMRWNNPQPKQVYVVISISVDATWNATSISALKDAVIAFVGGLDSENVEHHGLPPGSAVKSHEIESVISARGITDVSVSIGFSDTVVPGTRILSCTAKERSRTSSDKVVVNVI